MNEVRCRRLVDKAIDTFSLDLTGLHLLTEAATGYYMLTPLVAALAGADKVYAITRDSRFGPAKEVAEATKSLAKRWRIDERIQILFSREVPEIGSADIVTNLNFVRPLDAAFLKRLKPTAVIPLMWETWEYRPEDLDLDACRSLGLSVLGTNEQHPDLQTFRFVGHLATKLLFEMDVEVCRSKVVVVGSGHFGSEVAHSLEGVGADIFLVDPSQEGGLYSDQARAALATSDALVIAEHHSAEELIGKTGRMSSADLLNLNPGIVLAHIAGNIDQEDLGSTNIQYMPARIAKPGYMSVTVAYLGARPVIDLNTAGLKVGQQLASARLRGLNAKEAEIAVLKETSLAQGFSSYHKI